MKNWKFIKVGNSDKEFKSEQELRRWAIDHQYTYKPTHGGYYMLEDDSGKGREPIEAHVSQPVVNKTGNESILTKDGLVNYPDKEIGEINILKRELEGLMRMAEKDKSTDYSKQIEALKKEISEKKNKYALGNKKAKNESIEKQTWSMFKGLSKDAEKEVGNERYKGNQKYMNIPGYKQELERINRTYEKEFKQEKEEREKGYGRARSEEQVNDYWDRQAKALDIYYSDKIKTGNKKYHIWTDNGTWDRIVDEEELERLKTTYVNFHYEEVGNKVGNDSIGDEYNAEIYRLEKKKMDLERMGQGQKAREIEKQIQQLQKELREYDIGNKKTGNARLGKFLMDGGHTATLVEEGGKFIVKYDDGSTETFMTRKAAEAFLKVHSELYIGNKTGNRKIGSDDYEVVGSESGKYYVSKNSGQQILGPFASTDDANKKIDEIEKTGTQTNNLKRARNSIKSGNRKAIGSHFDMNDYGIEVGQWSWDWKGSAPDRKTMQDIARKIKDYARQIDRDVPEGDSDERDEVFAKLDRFMQTQGLK